MVLNKSGEGWWYSCLIQQYLKMVRSAVFVNLEGCNVKQDSWVING
jgi:hypothetical protein